jgi:uncharacterized membrane protein
MAEKESKESSKCRKTRRTPIQLGYLGTMIVLLITAMAGTAFAIGLLLLVWLLFGGFYSQSLLFLTVFSGTVTLVGVILLGFSRREFEQEQ